jgi:hypothetical protein
MKKGPPETGHGPFFIYVMMPKSVGAGGFEPPASWSRTKRATGLRYAPICSNNERKYTEHGAVNQETSPKLRDHPRVGCRVRPRILLCKSGVQWESLLEQFQSRGIDVFVN